MSNKDLPLWLQHHTGVVDKLTPEMIDAELKEHHNPEESFDAWYDRVGHKQHAALMGYYGSMAPGGKPPTGAIDWARLHGLIPWFAALAAWAMWGMFLLIPTAFNLHYAGMFPAASNWGYVLMGLTLCLAATVAAKVQHGVRAIAFTFSVLLLAYWF